jgi:tetratricopeptide (TPR) repeat protein
MNYLMIILTLMACSSPQKNPLPVNSQINSEQSMYREGQREFNKRNYKESLVLFNQYIEKNKNIKNKKTKERVFWAIDQVSRIYLMIYKDTDKAISFLESISKSVKLSEAEDDDISEWISVAKDWKKRGKLPKNIKNPEELFKLGEKFFEQGMEKLKYPADNAGNADFYIASTYLIPYVYNYDNGKRIGKALFMLGNIRFRSWNDYEYWTENFYLKEVIRRSPHSKLAQRAYKLLDQGIHAGYTGTAGDNTPPSQIKMLKKFKKLANPKM